MIYTFILGKNTALSVAEILSVLKRDRFVFVILSISTKALIIKLEKKIEDAQAFLNSLGGTIKIGEVFSETTKDDCKNEIIEYISKNSQKSKFVFGISAYDIKIKNLAFEIKKEIKNTGVSSRIVEGNNGELSSPEIKSNKILEKGADFLLVGGTRNKVFLGKTIAIQDFESYSHRDYDRPRRNAKSGMLPPKVAQIMLNLIPLTIHGAIYDPFCGQGTVLQEGALMGHQILGSDISKDRVYDTKENLSWLNKEYGTNIDVEKNIILSDALSIKPEILPIIPEAIVSEVYLGPPLLGNENPGKISEIAQDLSEMYATFLENAGRLFDNVGFIIIAIPFFKTKNGYLYLNIIDEIEKNRYNVISPFHGLDIGLSIIPEFNSKRNTLLYSRSDQIVGREIIILEKK